jgi:hypothetical protein
MMPLHGEQTGAAARHTHPKNTFASIKKLSGITFYSLKNQRKSLTYSLLATVSWSNIRCYH